MGVTYFHGMGLKKVKKFTGMQIIWGFNSTIKENENLKQEIPRRLLWSKPKCIRESLRLVNACSTPFLFPFPTDT